MGRAKRKPKKKAEPIVNEFAALHGDYQRTTISVTAGELEGEGHGQKPVTINRGGSTLQRWITAGSFDQSQLSAINHYSRAWHHVFSSPRVTANLSPIAFIRATGDEAHRVVTEIDAMELLKLLDDRIFSMAPFYYRDVWQNVVLYGTDNFPSSGKGREKAKERALTICLFIADMMVSVLKL